ncbi:MAG: Hsp70 family protein [Peptostreptococcaceae bacterium]
MGKIVRVGIDLGTTNTLVCAEKKGKIGCLKFERSVMLPSVLYVNEDQTLEVGQKAISKGVLDPNSRIKSAKTWIGDHFKTYNINGVELNPTSVATEVLKTVKQNIIKRLKLEEDDTIEAVITVPAYFSSNQIDETKKAGKNAGLIVTRIVTEPMAAALAYGSEVEVNKKIFVLDIGGGTLDISVLEVDYQNNQYNNVAVAGDKKLGGDDFDKVVVSYFNELIEDDLGIDLTSLESSGLSYYDYNSMKGRVEQEAENAKIELSESYSYEATILNLFEYNGKNYSFETTLTRDKFDNICSHLYDKIEDITLKLLEKKKDRFTIGDIGRVVLVGGTCYIPTIKDRVERIFKQPIYSDMDLSTMVATGACILATSIDGLQKEDNYRQIEIKDIISHSLGIEVQGENGSELDKILLKDSTYPISRKKVFTTTYDNQTEVDINVYEGEFDFDIDKNEFYGSLTLDGIENAPKGIPQIEVEFIFDESRILEVCAKDLRTGSSKHVRIKKGEKVVGAKQTPMNLMVLVDASGSMNTRMSDAKNACHSLIKDMIDFNIHNLGIIKFTSSASLISNLSSNKNHLLQSVNSITVSGSTNMHDAIDMATTILNKENKEKVIILITDGYPDSSDRTKEKAIIAKNSNIRLITIGAGDGVDVSMLNSISSITNGEIDSYKIDEMDKLTETFKSIMSSLTRC